MGEEETEVTQVDLKQSLKDSWSFIKKYYIILLILIPIFFCVYFRMQTFYLPITDDWAKTTVNSYFTENIGNAVAQQYPNLPDQQAQDIIASELKKAQQTEDYKNSVSMVSNQFKENMKGESGVTYLLELDPYFWNRYAENIMDHGYPADEIRPEGAWDTFRLAPTGTPMPTDNFNSYFIVGWYKVLKIFGFKDSMSAQFFIPVFLCALATLFAFLLAKRIGGNIAGFFASMLVAVNPAFLSRTPAGFADTDSYTVLMPLVIAYLLLRSIQEERSGYKILFGCLAGFSTALFAFAWLGWGYFYDVVLIVFFLYFAFLIAKNYKMRFVCLKYEGNQSPYLKALGKFKTYILTGPTRELITVGLFFSATSFVFVSLFRNVTVNIIPFMIYQFMIFKDVAVSSIWPNVLTTVAEQGGIAFGTFIDSLGGRVMFLFFFVGLIHLIYKKKILEAILLFIWFGVTSYAGITGMRYIQLVLPAFAILVGIGLQASICYISDYGSKAMSIKKYVLFPVLIIFALLLLVSPLQSAAFTAKNEIPMMNDAWYNSLKNIDANASTKTIITSWWDMGHWFKAVGNRPVTFDGTTQNTPQAHWVGKILLTSDEDEAMSILRMLDCGGNQAYDIVYKETKDQLKSINLIKQAIKYKKEDARLYLRSLVSEETSNKVVDEYMFCDNPPEGYFITSEDMIGKSGVWAHFGSWDFLKAQMHVDFAAGKDADYLSTTYNISIDKAEELFNDMQALSTNRDVDDFIAPWPSFAGSWGSCIEDNDTLVCQNNIQGNTLGFVIDTKTMNISLDNNPGVYPNSVVYLTEDGIKEKKFEGKLIGMSIALLPDNTTMVMTPEIATSMFTRMFLYNGTGLEHFKLFSYEKSFMNEDIYVWKVIW